MAPLGSLYSFLVECAALSSASSSSSSISTTQALLAQNKVSILLDTARGLEFIHAAKVAHGRLKTSNVLLFEGFRAKLADYNYNGFLSEKCENLLGCDGTRWLSPEDVDLIKPNGPDAPEQLQQKLSKSSSLAATMTASTKSKYKSYLSDLYALGLVILSTLSNKRPLDNILFTEGVVSHLVRGDRPVFPLVYPDKDVLNSLEKTTNLCITSEPIDRPPARRFAEELETLLCSMEMTRKLKEKTARDAKMTAIQAEITEFDCKIDSLEDLLLNGKKLIDKRDVREEWDG